MRQFQLNASHISSSLEKVFAKDNTSYYNNELAILLWITTAKLDRMIEIAQEYQNYQNNRISNSKKSIPKNIQCILQEEYLQTSGKIQNIYQSLTI